MRLYYDPSTGVPTFTYEGDPKAAPPGDYITLAPGTHLGALNGWRVGPGGELVEHEPGQRRSFAERVNEERARRIGVGVLVPVEGYGQVVALQGRPQDLDTLLGLSMAAQLRIQQGDTSTLTPFRDRDNADHMLTPPQIVDLWQKGMSWVQAVYTSSWKLKDQTTIPDNPEDDRWWPSSTGFFNPRVPSSATGEVTR